MVEKDCILERKPILDVTQEIFAYEIILNEKSFVYSESKESTKISKTMLNFLSSSQ